MTIFLGTALFLATIAIALLAIASTVIGALPRIAQVLGAFVPAEPRARLAPAPFAIRR